MGDNTLDYEPRRPRPRARIRFRWDVADYVILVYMLIAFAVMGADWFATGRHRGSTPSSPTTQPTPAPGDVAPAER